MTQPMKTARTRERTSAPSSRSPYAAATSSRPWGGTKLHRMREAGYEVVILDEGVEKDVSGADVRAAMRAGENWESLVPQGVARVIRSLDRVTA